jgi:hypothetical protein
MKTTEGRMPLSASIPVPTGEAESRSETAACRIDLFDLATRLGEMAGVLEGVAEGILLLRRAGHTQVREERTDWYLGVLEDRLLDEADRLQDFEVELMAAGREGQAPQSGRA